MEVGLPLAGVEAGVGTTATSCVSPGSRAGRPLTGERDEGVSTAWLPVLRDEGAPLPGRASPACVDTPLGARLVPTVIPGGSDTRWLTEDDAGATTTKLPVTERPGSAIGTAPSGARADALLGRGLCAGGGSV